MEYAGTVVFSQNYAEVELMGDKSPKNTNKAKKQQSQKKGMKPKSAPVAPINTRVKK